jgi:ubiquinol-cytochrome c reductase cytochrome b subunit
MLARIDPLLPFTGAILVLLSALAQVNPVWLYGPYTPGGISSGSVPDWYMGFVDGALRIMPGWEFTIGGHPVTLAVLVPGVIVPGIFFTFLAGYPLLDRFVTGARPARGLLPPRPGDPANRIAAGVAGISFYGLLWAAASNDEIAYHLGLSLYAVTWAFRVLVLAGPVLAFGAARLFWHVAADRHRDEAEHGFETGVIRQDPAGGYHEDRVRVAADR